MIGKRVSFKLFKDADEAFGVVTDVYSYGFEVRTITRFGGGEIALFIEPTEITGIEE